MKKIFCLFILVLFIGGCGSKAAPTWYAAGHQQLETFKEDFLSGRAPFVTENHFQKAVEEIKKGGDLDLLGKAWLTRMALQIAVLENPEAGEYRAIAAVEAVPGNDQFHLLLTDDAARVDGTLLPAQYRPLLQALQSGSPSEAERAVVEIDAPLSRLIAAGLAVRRNLVNEAILQSAVQTASQNGWKRALLAWLERLAVFHETAGEAAKAASIRQRMGVLGP